MKGLEALAGLRGGAGALTPAEAAALERARAVHALSTGTTGLERIDSALSGHENAGEALAGMLREAMERDAGLTKSAFAHLRATAPEVLARALDAEETASGKTPLDLIAMAVLRGTAPEAAEGMAGDMESLMDALDACAARQGPGGHYAFGAALWQVVFGDGPARTRARAVATTLDAARPGLRGWETDGAPYVLNLCEGMEARPWAMAGGASAEVERLADPVLPVGVALTGDARLLRGLVRTALGRRVLARATERDPALARSWTAPPAPGEEPVLWAALAACIAGGADADTEWTRGAPAPWGVRDTAGMLLTERIAASGHRGLAAACVAHGAARTAVEDAGRARLVAALAESAPGAPVAPVRTVTRTAADGAVLEVEPQSAVLREIARVRVRTTAGGRRWAMDTWRLQVRARRAGGAETLDLSDTEMARLARGMGKVESGETFDRWVADNGYLHLVELLVTVYDARVAGVDGAADDTFTFDDGHLALEHGIWPLAPERYGARESTTPTVADQIG